MSVNFPVIPLPTVHMPAATAAKDAADASRKIAFISRRWFLRSRAETSVASRSSKTDAEAISIGKNITALYP